MKDDISTPIPEDSSTKGFERGKPGTAARDDAEAAFEDRAEAALRESEAKYRSLFETMGQGYSLNEVVRDAEGHAIDLRYVELNPAFERLTGASLSEARGQLASHVFPGLDRYWVEICDRAVTSGVIESVEHELTPNGRWYRSSFYPIGGDRLLCLYDDITDQKRAELTLRQNQERQAFLLKFSDALRAEPDADAAANRAITLLYEHMQIDRCYMTFYRPENDEADFPYQVGNDSVPPLPAKIRLSDFPDAYEQVLEKTYIIEDDFERRGLTETERAKTNALGMRAMLASTVRRGERTPIASLVAVSSTPRRWTPGEIALVEEAAERAWAAMERAGAEAALRKSEERYRKLFESMDQAYAVVEVLKDDAGKWADFRFLEVNPAFMKHTTMPYPVGKTATELLGTPNPRWTELYGQALDTGRPMRIEEPEAALGLTFDLNIFSLDRPKNRVAILFTNITERKQAEAALRRSERHAQTLLAELQHRVRNTLAVVRSIARRTADNSTSVDDMLGHFQGRLNSFSRVQAALTRNPSPSINLASLIEDELAAHGARDGEQIGIAGPDIFLEPRTAEQLSLAIHELTTNAVKHGALVGDRGTLRIRWKKERLNGGEELVLTWIESGVKLSGEGPGREGFGIELLQRSLPYDLRAETEFDFRPDGLRFELRMPLREPAEVD